MKFLEVQVFTNTNLSSKSKFEFIGKPHNLKYLFVSISLIISIYFLSIIFLHFFIEFLSILISQYSQLLEKIL